MWLVKPMHFFNLKFMWSKARVRELESPEFKIKQKSKRPRGRCGPIVRAQFFHPGTDKSEIAPASIRSEVGGITDVLSKSKERPCSQL